MLTVNLTLTDDTLQVSFSIAEFSQEILAVKDSTGRIITSDNASEKDNQLIMLLLDKYADLGDTFLDIINDLKK